MRHAQDYYPQCPEAIIVSLARSGDRSAFAELVRRRQTYVRNLMRRCCGDITLADDLAQQVFLQVWRKIYTLKRADAFAGWLKRLAISVWLGHQRKNDALRNTNELSDSNPGQRQSTSTAMDLERALSTLSAPVRLCIVLSYQEGMSHSEIAEATELPLGTIKSHILRGTKRLRKVLSAYQDETDPEELR